MPLSRLAAVLAVAAATTGEVQARCTDRPLSQTGSTVANFLNRPEGLLERFPAGDETLSILVREIVTADPNATLDPAIKLLRLANAPQRRAIGVGLGNAARLCMAASDTGMARRVQEIVRRQNDSTLNAGFVSAYTERAGVPLLPSAPPAQPPTNALGRGSIADPRTDPFKPSTLPNPASPLRPQP